MYEQRADRTWQERVGGKYLITRRAYIYSSLLALTYTAQIQDFGSLDFGVILKWLSIFIAAVMTQGLVTYLLHRTIFSSREITPVALPIALIMHAAHGLLFVFSMLLGAQIFDLNQGISPIFQIIFGTTLATWWGSTLSLFLDHLEDNRKAREILIEEAVSSTTFSLKMNELNQSFTENIYQKAAVSFAQVEPILKQSASNLDWAETSRVLKELANNEIRPLSHAMLKAQQIEYPKIRWWRLPLNIVKNQPINIWLTIIIACVSSLPQQIKLFGFNRALTLNVAIYIAIAIVGGVANKLMNFYPRFRATFFVSASLLLQITIPISVHFRNQWIPGISGTGWQVSQFFSGLALLLLTSGFGGWFSLQEKLNMNFREELQQRHIELIAVSRQFAYATREASKLLHGQVQSKLVACAMAIDVAAQSGDENKIKDAVQSALRIITSPLSSSVVASNLLEELNRKASLWGEICSIEIEVGDHLSTLTSDQVVQLGRVVEEGISNAIRHGRAKKIVIAVKRVSPDSISVKILDNGVGPQNGQPSMGSALIGQASGGNWTLEAVENGTLLSMKTRG